VAEEEEEEGEEEAGAAAAVRFAEARAVETVLREGEVLFLPTKWFHLVQLLGYSVQCNTRFGAPAAGHARGDAAQAAITRCMHPATSR
jgi:hypothetical protein